MKRLLSIIIAMLLFSAPLAMAQDYNMWVTTEGAGFQISSGYGGYRMPPPRYDRHHYHHGKKMKKRAKELRKARKKYIKAQRKFYRDAYPHRYQHHHHHHDDD
ncbi:MAG: hypothetical protein K2F64_07035 [Muribaculaceae bacterium]|nr:hypothetical protein [Muribaculaceae bacterium]